MILFSRCTRRGYRYCKFLKYAGVQDMAPIMDRYGALEHIGEGTFGKVYKSVAQETGKPVAIKIVPLDPDAGLPFTVIREIKVLKRLKHPSILNLLDICISGGSIAMVLDYMPYDIAGLMAQKYNFTNDHIRSFTYQMIAAVSHMHKMGLIHRDLKPSNLLLDASGHLKIADFGLTKRRSECMTNRVCTLWYRAPELLLGDTSYSDKVDSWSIGCIILELKRGIPFFRGRDEVSQTLEVLSKLGCPQNNYPWNSLFDVSRYEKNLPWKCVAADAFSSFLDDEMLALVGELLRIDKNARISVTNALEMPAVKRGVNLHVPLDPIVVSKKGVE